MVAQRSPHRDGARGWRRPIHHQSGRVDAENGRVREILQEAYWQGVSWTPDGERLIASSGQGSRMSYPPTFNLWIVPLDGGPPSQVTFGEASYEFPDLGAQGQLVSSRVRVLADVWKFPVTNDPVENARRGVRITRQTGVVQTVSLSADESQVVFLSDNGGHANIWTARIADGEMRPVTRESDSDVVVAVPVWSPRGDWINFLTTAVPGLRTSPCGWSGRTAVSCGT